MTKEELVVTSAIAQNILQAQEILGLHADGNNSGQCQICAFGKYENGFPLLDTMPANIGGQPAQSDDVKGLKGIVRSFGSQDIFSNGNEMR